MAASDATYRNVKTLHVLFAVTSVVMLLTIVGMFADDFYRDWKVEQRLFFDVEEEMAKRAVLAAAPSEERIEDIANREKDLLQKKADLKAARAQMEQGLGDLPARKQKTENEFATVKASYDSVMSFINYASQQVGGLQSKEAVKYQEDLSKLGVEMTTLKAEVEENDKKYKAAAVAVGLPAIESDIAEMEKKLKEDVADFDRFLKLATQKSWGVGMSFRTLPILDAFASPTRIQQYTLNDLPIDYSFMHVTRYDRCTTCHLGMEKAAYDPASLAKLAEEPGRDKELRTRFMGAKKLLEARKAAGVADLPDPKDMEPQRIDPERLTPGRVKQFAAHPRLDLFVDANSPHNAESFGCSICHGGQGSATAFYEASHAPNDNVQKGQWAEKYHWKSNHYWDFPMQPNRFIESSCVKCHHEMTDLIRHGNKEEAPKLTRGYNLVKELGCFGCHEISGFKAGRRIGPDLRLEPNPALDVLSPADRAAALADPQNPPGQQRRVGPSLDRLAEKTNEEWVRLWLKSPRGFRENTKMPHFYLQANNRPDALPEEQKKFPDNEIHAISHYLLSKSQAQVEALKKVHGENPDARQTELKQVADLTVTIRDLEKQLADPQLKEAVALRLKLAEARIAFVDAQTRVSKRDEMLSAATPVSLQKVPANSDPKRGRALFQERGCMACHSHQSTEKATEDRVDGKPIPPMVGDASFGPDLSRVAHKLVPQGGAADDGRKWLVSWLLNPSAHSPRTLMPDTQLDVEQAGHIAAWLLSEKAEWKLTENEQVPPADFKTLQDMAQLHLKKVLSLSEVREVMEMKNGGFTARRLREIAGKNLEADELELGGDLTGKKDDEIIPLDEHKLKMYVGKKAIGNLGCYSCHNVPGFQNAKPIGVALNEWGKKDVERIAFEDSHHFVHDHFNVLPTRVDAKDKAKPSPDWKIKGGKKPYEGFFADKLDHHGKAREGFLHLKLEEPRSYDYNRLRSWEDRLRMPQFKFARPKRLPDETREQYEARTIFEEAEAREAVMTFILGLVAEQIPARYVNVPTGDRLNEVRGREVLDKFNCAGCHIVRPGSVEFKMGGALASLETRPPTSIFKHNDEYKADDYFQSDHIAWAGHNGVPADRAQVAGVKPWIHLKRMEDDEPTNDAQVRLTQAFRFREGNRKDGALRDVMASDQLRFAPQQVTRATKQYGGAFIDQLAPYLQRKDPENYGGADNKVSLAYAASPPSLLHEGEKVRPDWLYRFLRNPYKIRELTVLRMPKFNMSSDEAQALVNYFAAVDKTENVGIGLTYPYVPIPQQDDGYLERRTREYVERLRAANQLDARKQQFQPSWEKALGELKAEADARLAQAEKLLAAAPDAAKVDATKARDEAKKFADAAKEKVAKKDVSELATRWETREAYLADASRLVVHGNICLTCHHAGGVEGKERKGPNLDNVADRLRPDWLRRWITHPNRFQHYDSVMPINFKRTARDYQDAFVGTSDEQIEAVRDFLMLYPQAREWPVLRAREPLGMGATPTPAAAPGGK